MIDTFYTRRGHYFQCRWWTRLNTDEDLDSKFLFDRKPQGIFFSKELTPQSESSSALLDAFHFEQASTQISTNDDIEGIKVNDIIEFKDKLWRVENLQKSVRRKECEYCTEVAAVWVLQLRR